MASTDLAVVDNSSSFSLLPQALALADQIAKTDFVPKAMRGNPGAIVACVLSGNELGIGPMQSLQKIHVIEGRPAMAAELMRALILGAGHDLWVEDQTSTKCTIAGQRAGSTHVTRVTWTIDDAKRANLAGKPVWRSYPRAMLLARATAEIARMVFPDVLAGLSYASEEVEDGFIWDAIEAEGEPVEEQPKQRRRAPAAKKAAGAAKKAAPAPTAQLPQPPLPGEDPLGDAAEAAVADDEIAKKRRQLIAMRCTEAGVDRADLVAAITVGRTRSARDLTADECSDALEALRQIKEGTLELVTDGEVPDLVDTHVDEQAPDEDIVDGEILEDDPATSAGEVAAGWDAAAWRAEIRARNLKVVDVIRYAQSIASECDATPPANPAAISETPELAARVVAWMDEQ